MKKNWEYKKLEDVCELSAGGDVPKDSYSEVKSSKFQIPIYANGEKNEGLYGYTEIARITKPSITISARGTIGYSVKRTTPFFPIVRLIVATPKDKNKLDLGFLEYAIKSIDFKHSGSSIPQLTVPMIGNYQIPIPPILEQLRIVEVLGKSFAAIDKAKTNTEKNLQNVRELFESYLEHVFSNRMSEWTEDKLSDVFEVRPPKSEVKDKLKADDYVSFFPMEDLKVLNYYTNPTKEKRLKEVIGSYTYFKNDDVLLAKITPCFENGKIGIAKNMKNGIGFGSSEYNVFRSKGLVIPEYLYYFLSRQSFREIGKRYMSGAVGHKRISKEFIEEYLILYPINKRDQKLIVDRIGVLASEVKKIETCYRIKCESFDELKKAILQKAFSGGL